jgi:hypothetical protein
MTKGKKQNPPHNVGDVLSCQILYNVETNIYDPGAQIPDIGIIVEVKKVNGRYKYKIAWQRDTAVLGGYETSDIVAFKEIYEEIKRYYDIQNK